MKFRDLTKAQFLRRAAEYGWTPVGIMGYFKRRNLSVSVWNAGDRRRSQLAYLIVTGEKQDREDAMREAVGRITG